jgi:hypothetical protein
MIIDSSGRVSIGTSTIPTSDSVLTIRKDGSANEFNILSGTSSASVINMGDSDDYNIQRIKADNTDNSLHFQTNNSEKMRIDSSGNLLVGKTSTSGDVVGHRLSPDGRLLSTADSNYVVQLNRKTSDGSIAEFRKDGSTVGSITSNGGAIIIGSSDVGVYFDSGSDRIIPVNVSTNSVRNDAIDIGGNPHRFKDLYLSGSAYTSNIYGQNDTNTGIQFEGSDLITIHTGGAERMRIDANGHVTMPNQPAFSAKLSSSQSNIAVGSDLSVQFNTEIFDQNADFNTANYTFTAPVTGRYQFNIYYYLENIDTATGYYYIFFDTSNRNYFNIISPAFTSDTSYLTLTLSVLVDMDANDVAVAKIRQSHGTSQTDINANSYFSGYLVA